MFVKFRQPYFVNGACEYEANKPLDVPDEIAMVEIAKGFAVRAGEPAPESKPKEQGEKRGRKK